MLWRTLLVITLAGAMASCATGPTTTGTSTLPTVEVEPRTGTTAPPASISAARATLKQALSKANSRDFAAASALLEPLLASSDLALLPAHEQHYAVFLGGITAMNLRKLSRAQELLLRSSAMPSAGVEDWRARLQVSYRLRDIPDASMAMATLVQRWPGALREFDDGLAFSLMREAQALADDSSYFQLLNALYVSEWQPRDFTNVTTRWVDLALMYLQRNQPQRAAEVARKITSPTALIIMHADRRFDDIVQASPETFNVEAALAREISKLTETVKQFPRSIDAHLLLARRMTSAMKGEEALSLIDAVIKKATAAPPDQLPYDSLSDKLRWTYDMKAMILEQQGRWQDALKARKLALDAAKQSSDNISQSINLASLYLDLRQPEQAQATIAHLDQGDGSPYGRMQSASVRHEAWLQMRNETEANRALDYLRKNWKDSPGTLQSALITANKLDDAAEILITRLSDPKLRHSALQSLQIYVDTARTPEMGVYAKRYREMLARADVIAAIDRVGRINRYNLVD